MTRMRFSFRSARDQLCTTASGPNPRDPDLNTFKIRRLAIAGMAPGRKVWAMRSTKGEQTRAAIVEAALRMFREQGYEATTMRAIAVEDRFVHRGNRRVPAPGARGTAQPAARTAMAVLDGDRAVLGARHLAGVQEDLPAHRLDRAARRAPDLAGPGARAAVADPAAATGRRRPAALTPEPRTGRAG